MLFAAYFAPFYLSFSTKTHAILYQNVRHFVPKRTPFSGKTHSILHQNTLRFAANSPETAANGSFSHINIHSAACTCQPYFASKQTFARIDYLRSKGQLVDKTGTHNVKNHTEKWTIDWRVDSSACQPKAIVRSALAAISICRRLLSARHAVLNGVAWAYCGGCATLLFALC